MSIDLNTMPKLGFGLMRLPEKDGKIDISHVSHDREDTCQCCSVTKSDDSCEYKDRNKGCTFLGNE